MKKFFIAFMIMFLFGGVSAFSQVTVDDVDINKLDIKYCEVVAKAAMFSMKVVVFIDYGQDFSWKAQTIKGSDGKDMQFNSVIAALNFMYKNGWDYSNNFVVTDKNGSIYHYLLKKKEQAE